MKTEHAKVRWQDSYYTDVKGVGVRLVPSRVLAHTPDGLIAIANPEGLKDGDHVTVRYEPGDRLCTMVAVISLIPE